MSKQICEKSRNYLLALSADAAISIQIKSQYHQGWCFNPNALTWIIYRDVQKWSFDVLSTYRISASMGKQ